LWSLRLLNSPLQGHPDKRFLPILEASTGSLGQGLSIGLGMALGARLNKDDFYTYVLLGDGECDEGQVWEAAMAAAHFQVDNLIAIVDKNKQQLDGWTKDIMGLEPFGEKWKSFGWEVKEIDGHNFSEIISAFEEAKKTKGKPFVIIAHTIKGKGVSFMENNLDFHGAAPTKEETERALKEIEESNS
ncbi:MAG: transketolase, partial [Actinomycetia bacterium]|nr:transketolase [Actinomycetes bacterium]